jgi:hypothetical protein
MPFGPPRGLWWRLYWDRLGDWHTSHPDEVEQHRVKWSREYF